MVELESLEIVVKELHKLEEENKKLKEERDNFMLKYTKAIEEKIVETNKLCTERNKLGEENKNLNEKVRFLEECLDRKEKLNEKYRKEIDKLKSTYVYDAKQVRDVC
jgi:DNA gyrase/topoisomerase IV subunit A